MSAAVPLFQQDALTAWTGTTLILLDKLQFGTQRCGPKKLRKRMGNTAVELSPTAYSFFAWFCSKQNVSTSCTKQSISCPRREVVQQDQKFSSTP